MTKQIAKYPNLGVHKMFTEEQKHYTGRAMLALAAAYAEVVEAVKALAEFDPVEAGRIAESIAKNATIAAGLCQLAIAAAPSGIMEDDPASFPARERL